MAKTKPPSIILIIGLGNPGEQYKNTPHNAGFIVLNALAEFFKTSFAENKKLKSEIAEIDLRNLLRKSSAKKIILAKPQTFMNNSGTAAKLLIDNYRLPITSNFWLIHDDIDLEIGRIKIVKNRGSAGHKGVLDVIKKLKTQDFVRFRLGTRPKRIPAKRSKQTTNKFVASDLLKSEQTLFKKNVERAADAAINALENGIEKAASMYNQ